MPGMMQIHTARLEMTAASVELSEAEMGDRPLFERLLNATVPPNWPPETAADALPWFLEMLRGNPGWLGWLSWYAVRVDRPTRVLVGSGGFKGGPDASGIVEIGYSVLPEFQRQGIATEIVIALTHWAMSHGEVARVEAETSPDNIGSCGVLARTRFRSVGPGTEPGSVRFCLDRVPPSVSPAQQA